MPEEKENITVPLLSFTGNEYHQIVLHLYKNCHTTFYICSTNSATRGGKYINTAVFLLNKVNKNRGSWFWIDGEAAKQPRNELCEIPSEIKMHLIWLQLLEGKCPLLPTKHYQVSCRGHHKPAATECRLRG